MKVNSTCAALTLLAAATLLAGCERTTTVTQTSPSTTTTTTTLGPSAAASSAMASTASAVVRAGDAVSDAASDAIITSSVKAKLLADPDVKGLQIDVDANNGVVTLNGSADTAANADKALAIAKGTQGVVSVENKLIVK